LDGSRALKNDVCKRSYHIIVVNGAFASNSGVMKSFVKDFVEENNENTLFWWDDKGKHKSIIDSGVYTRNRCLRTPLSAKGDDLTATKLQRIERIESKDDAGNVSIVWEPRPFVSKEEILKCLVTYIPDDLSIIPDSESASNSQRRASGVSRRQNPRPAPSKQNSEYHAAIIAQVQGMVDTAGGSGCVVYRIQEECDDGTMRIQCKNSGLRKCLVTKDEVHENNNAGIMVHANGTVWYHCYSPLPCKEGDCNCVKIGKLSEPDSESSESEDDEAPNGDVSTQGNESSINCGHDDAMRDDDEAPTNDFSTPDSESSIDGGHNDAMHDNDEGTTTESDTELLQREEGLDIAPSLGKRTPTSISVGDDVSAENDKKRVCTGRATNEAQTDVSFRSLKCGTVDLSGMERVLKVDPPLEGKVLMARGDSFQTATKGVDARAGTETQTDVIATGSDPRPHDYRMDMYLNDIFKTNPDLFSDQQRLKAVAMIVTAASPGDESRLKVAKSLLKSMCTSKVHAKSVKSAFKKIGKMVILKDPLYALAVLQQLYVSAKPDSKKHEYGSYEEVKEETEQRFIKIERPYAFVQVSKKDSRDFNVAREDAVRGVTRSTSYYKWLPEKKPKDADDDWVATYWSPVKCEFTRDWMRDESIKTCEKIDFDPSKPYGPSRGEDSVFNTWTSFDAKSFVRVSDEESAQAFKRYRDYAVQLMGHKLADFWLNWVAIQIQYPSQKTKVAWLLQGEMGCGKTYLVEVIMLIMGTIASFQTGRPNEDLFDRFSAGFKRKILVLVISPLLLRPLFLPLHP
jgi:hypothetical protein